MMNQNFQICTQTSYRAATLVATPTAATVVFTPPESNLEIAPTTTKCPSPQCDLNPGDHNMAVESFGRR